MSEEKTTTEEQEVLIEETQDAMPEGVDFLEEPQAELSELDAAIQARMGQFAITISPADLRYIKNLLNNKIEWKGPNEAYLMLMALLSINGELKERDSSSNERIFVHREAFFPLGRSIIL